MSEFKVLIPLDGSRLAETGLAYLTYLKQFGALHVTLISVTAAQSKDRADRDPSVLGCYLRAVSDSLRARLGLPVELMVPTGEPVECLLEAVSAVSPDLLIITTHGWSGINRLRHGSVSDRVVRAVSCPVLSVGPNVLGRIDWVDNESRGPFNRILVPLDGSKLAEEALPIARSFADTFDSEVHIVRIVPETELVDAALTNQYEQVDSLLFGAEGYVKDIAAHSGLRSVKALAIAGNPIEALRNYASRNDIDLVVMTSNGRRGFARAAYGSVADRMITGPVPVLLVPSPTDHGPLHGAKTETTRS